MAKVSLKKQNVLRGELSGELDLKNALASPKVVKITLNSGLGRVLQAASKPTDELERISQELALITGQQPVVTKAKKSIASFKTRVGQPLGLKVTLRGKRMEDFLNRLIHVALPRSRDFKGISMKGIDNQGNLTVGIKEHTIFPEVSDAPRTVGFEVTLVTNTENKERSIALFRKLGVPFSQE